METSAKNNEHILINKNFVLKHLENQDNRVLRKKQGVHIFDGIQSYSPTPVPESHYN